MPDLELLRVTDISALERWWGIHDAAMTADHVALPADPIAELVPSLSGSEAGYAVELWLARSAGADVGCARLSRPLHDNVTLADLELTVSPGCRGRGHGTRLAEAMLSRVRELGATTVTAEICRPLGAESGDSPAARIATRQGARPALAELRRLLDLMAGEPDGLAELEAEAAGHAAGYTMVSWADRAAEDDVADLADLMGRMSTDAPSGELTREPEVWDAARYREKEDSTLAKGRRRLSVAARENATGRLVGFTDIGVSIAVPTIGYQWDTLVRSDHRGHRLGLLMKLANLRQVRERSPQTRFLNTWNAESNAPMVSVNERLGFVVVEAWEEWQLHLGDQVAALA